MASQEKLNLEISKTEVIKNYISIFKDIVFLILLIVILCQWDVLTQWLTGKGINKLAIAGIFEIELGQTQNASSKSLEIANELETKVKPELEQIKTQITDEILKSRIDSLLKQVNSLSNQSKTINQQLEESIKSIGQIQKQTQQQQENTIPSIRSWGIIIGADKKPEAAIYEVNQAKDQNFTNISLFLRNDFYRTVIEFSTQEEALTQLKNVQEKIREGSYIVNLSVWCPNPIPKEISNYKGKAYECK